MFYFAAASDCNHHGEKSHNLKENLAYNVQNSFGLIHQLQPFKGIRTSNEMWLFLFYNIFMVKQTLTN